MTVGVLHTQDNQMAIRKIHSNNVTTNRADIATQYDDIFFDDVANSILLPDPTGLLETKIGASGSSSGIKGFASGYVDAGQFVTLDNIKATVTTTGLRTGVTQAPAPCAS